jgi:hypothetical protein
MRPVTQAPPRAAELEPNQEEDHKLFKVKIDQIQEIVDKYERMKKDVELERMRQE